MTGRALLVIAVGVVLLAGCGKIAPNKPHPDGVATRYPYEPADLYNPTYPASAEERDLARAQRAQQAPAQTEVIVRQRVEIAPGQVQTAPSGAVLRATDGAASQPTAPAPADRKSVV